MRCWTSSAREGEDPRRYTRGRGLPARGILNTVLPSADRYADCAPFLGLAICAMALAGLAASADRRTRWIALAAGVAALIAQQVELRGCAETIKRYPSMAAATDPNAPSHVFPGLTRGASLCFPKCLPT